MLKTINIGAEARISLDKDCVVKERIPKGYRAKELDLKIRKQRTKREAKLISDASRAGVMVPKVLEVDDFTIKMEHIDGPRVKDILDAKNMKAVCYEIGKSVADLHNASIIHGDLTTSNMICKDSGICFIDFGLGFISDKAEDKATDLHLLEEAIDSTHYRIASGALKIVFESYLKDSKDGKAVLSRLEQIRLRGRYVNRNGE
ncbi:MAG: Kae1-associated serine/threonine protein kinase [Candidatus Aenigmarchaeota archaeon]|nr:Kae1-associated serine/threonine protein kinase [Candidatus Aenigmarchaeota archaeon]